MENSYIVLNTTVCVQLQNKLTLNHSSRTQTYSPSSKKTIKEKKEQYVCKNREKNGGLTESANAKALALLFPKFCYWLNENN